MCDLLQQFIDLYRQNVLRYDKLQIPQYDIIIDTYIFI